MKVFLKLALKNIKLNKSKYLLLIITLSLTTVVMLATVLFKDSAMKNREDQLRDSTLNSQLLIRKVDGKDIYFNPKEVMTKIENIKGIKSIVERSGGMAKDTTSSKDINIVGVDFEKQQQTYSFKLKEEIKLGSNEHGIMISEKYASENNLKLGSKIELKTTYKSMDFIVRGISENTGIFNTNMNIGFIEMGDAEDIFDKHGMVYSLGITLENLDSIDFIAKEVSGKISSNLTVDQRYDINYFKAFVGTIDIALKIFGIFALFIALYLTYSTFSLIIFERSRQIGIMKTLGITKRNIIKAILVENSVIVMLSVLLGAVIAFPVVKIMLNYISNGTSLIFNWRIMILEILLLWILSLVTVILTLKKILSSSVISLLKGINLSYLRKRNVKKLCLALLILIAALSVLFLNFEEFNSVIFMAAGAVFFTIAFILLMEVIHVVINRIFGKAVSFCTTELKSLFREITRQFSRVAEIIVVISIVVSLAFLSSTIYNMVNNSASKVYSSADLFLSVNGANAADYTNSIGSINGVDYVTSQLRANVKLNGMDVVVAGIDPDSYKKFSFEIIKDSDTKDIFSPLINERAIIITTTFSKNTGVKYGDSIDLYGQKYKVTGVVSSFENMGKVLFVSKDNFKKDLKNFSESYYLIKANKAGAVDSIIKETRLLLDKQKNNYGIQEIKSYNEQNRKNNERIFNIISALLIISVCVCTISLNNNLIINILAKEKEFAIKRTLGMSNKLLCKTILFEGLLLGLEGGVLGVLLGSGLNVYVSRILSYYIGDMVSVYDIKTAILLIIIAGAVGVISSIYPLLRMFKINLMQTVKCVD